MASAISFHPLCGKNITLMDGKKTAAWCSAISGGSICSDSPLKPLDSVTINVGGSGRVEVGFICQDPAHIWENSDNFLNPTVFTSMNELRFHKRTCSISLSVDFTGKKVSSLFREVCHSVNIRESSTVWLAILIRFGAVSITMFKHDGRPLKFSRFHGNNIRLSEDSIKAETIKASPGAVCATDRPLLPDETLVVRANGIVEEGKIPSNYHMTIVVSRQGPDEVSSMTDTYLSDVHGNSSNFITIESLKKLECEGDLNICLKDKHIVEYKTANNKTNSQRLNFSTEHGVWLYFELYRVQLTFVALLSNEERPRAGNADVMMAQRIRRNPGAYVTVRCNTAAQGPNFSHRRSSIQRSESQTILKPEEVTYVDTEYLSVLSSMSRLSSASCPENLHKFSKGSGDEILGKLSNIEAKVNSIGQHFRSISVTQERSKDESQLETVDGVTARDFSDIWDLRDPIRKNYVELLNSVQTDSFCDHLYQYEILSEDVIEKIMTTKKHDPRDANRLLLNHLTRKKVSKSMFVKILQNSGNEHLVGLFL